jgi:hypothetical protein
VISARRRFDHHRETSRSLRRSAAPPRCFRKAQERCTAVSFPGWRRRTCCRSSTGPARRPSAEGTRRRAPARHGGYRQPPDHAEDDARIVKRLAPVGKVVLGEQLVEDGHQFAGIPVARRRDSAVEQFISPRCGRRRSSQQIAVTVATLATVQCEIESCIARVATVAGCTDLNTGTRANREIFSRIEWVR